MLPNRVCESTWYSISLLEKIEPHEGGLTPLPSQTELFGGEGHQLGDGLFQHRIGHSVHSVILEQMRSIEIKTVVAVEVTVRSGRFYQHSVQIALT